MCALNEVKGMWVTMKNRRSILLIIILMVVGFAAVSTTLLINGNNISNMKDEEISIIRNQMIGFIFQDFS